MISYITVVGAGTMGNGIAHVYAQNGYQVNMVDLSEQALKNGIATINKNLDRMVAKGSINDTVKQSTLAAITTNTNIAKGVKLADLVIEAATENELVKTEIFKTLDAHCKPSAILASNTSSISITKLASVTKRPDRVIGMHFMNPVPIMQLVEVINGYNTSPLVTQTIVALSKKLGKTPTVVKDYPGFIANRILMPMINEAIESLYHGVASIKEIDTVMKLGMAHPMGPLQLADFIGLDVCLSILNVLYHGFKNSKYAPCPLLVNMVQAGKLGVKTGEGFYDYSLSKKAEKISAQFI